jgi:hypothetical protein
MKTGGRAVLAIGLIAGTLDIADSLIFNAFRGITPAMVFRYIASGLIGMNAAADGGLEVVLLGVALHYLIALIWTGIFFAASRRLRLLTARPVGSGLAYGIVVYLVMNWIVLPLSRVPHVHNATMGSRINGVLAVVLFIGLTISLLMRRLAPAAERFDTIS